MENKSTFYIFPDSDNYFFPNVKNTFFAKNTHNIKIRNTRIPIYISANTKEFNIKKLKEDVNSVYKQKRNKLIKQLENLDKDYKKFLEKYNNTNKFSNIYFRDKINDTLDKILKEVNDKKDGESR